MIALSGCIGKCFHLILANRFTAFLTENKFIDETVQKAFLPGINGCVEHNVVMDEIIKDAKTKHRTVHITFFDLEDAFGSVPHQLIQHSLQRNHLPQNIQQYCSKLYQNANTVVK